jgi:methionine synthase II (cobalamin-independent)
VSAGLIKLSSVQDTTAAQANPVSAAQQADAVPDGVPWPAASATGIGSMPGTDPAEACAVVFGEVPDLPFLPELPNRGVGADMIGRAASLLVDMPVEATAQGWKLATHPGRDQQRAASFLSYDLDAFQQAADGYEGPLKIAVCGPLTLAARIELSRSQNPALADQGALADLTASLAEGVAAHVRQIRERLPGARVILQLDEPALPAVLVGRVPTASGLNTVRALDQVDATAAVRSVLEAAPAYGVVHCCGTGFPFLLMKEAGAGAVSFDLGLVTRGDIDAIAELAEAGRGLLVGAVPTAAGPTRSAAAETSLIPTGPPAATMPAQRAARETAQAVVTLWRRTDRDPRLLAGQVVITPACGLAGLPPETARATLAQCREAARIAAEMIEGTAQ